MSVAQINGVILDESISKKLGILQNGYAQSLANDLNDAIGFLLENRGYLNGNDKKLLNILETLYDAQNEFLAIIPEEKKGDEL